MGEMEDDISCYAFMAEDYLETREQGREPVEVDYIRIIRESEKAFLILFDKADIFNQKKEWIPKSQIGSIDDYDKVVVIPEWLAVEKGLV